MNEYMYILYTDNYIFGGFYDDLLIVQRVIDDTSNNITMFNKITCEMRDYILQNAGDNIDRNPILDSSKVVPFETIIDSKDYILNISETVTETINIEKIKRNLISLIKSQCGNYIVSGCSCVLTSGELKVFSYNLEDQINLKNISDNYNSGSFMYHALGEYDSLYSYNDIVSIYKQLENNKNYNLIYKSLLCNWINNNYTLEMYESKIVISYGFTTDEISEQLNKLYNQVQLN